MPKNFLSLRAVHKVQPCVAVYCRTVPYGALPYRCLPYRQLYVTVLYGTALASNMNISKKHITHQTEANFITGPPSLFMGKIKYRAGSGLKIKAVINTK